MLYWQNFQNGCYMDFALNGHFWWPLSSCKVTFVQWLIMQKVLVLQYHSRYQRRIAYWSIQSAMEYFFTWYCLLHANPSNWNWKYSKCKSVNDYSELTAQLDTSYLNRTGVLVALHRVLFDCHKSDMSYSAARQPRQIKNSSGSSPVECPPPWYWSISTEGRKEMGTLQNRAEMGPDPLPRGDHWDCSPPQDAMHSLMAPLHRQRRERIGLGSKLNCAQCCFLICKRNGNVWNWLSEIVV